MPKKRCCCGPPTDAEGTGSAGVADVPRVDSSLSVRDRLGLLLCRLSDRFRSRHRVAPGLYALGHPDADSPVLVSCNYRMSFDVLRGSCRDLDAWILVLDTAGINVWCAAAKGTFGTRELVSRIRHVGLDRVVSHRQIIVPQLGAAGVAAREVARETGFRVRFGPVRATDVPRYLENGCLATPQMRQITFPLADRLALVPMELFPAAKRGLLLCAGIALLMGLGRDGISLDRVVWPGAPLAMGIACAILAGAVLHPILLPLFPVRAFTVQGAILGVLCAIPFALHDSLDIFARGAILVGMPAIASYLALNFTGCTTFVNRSGVRKELLFAWPFYAIAAVAASAALILCKLRSEGFIT